MAVTPSRFRFRDEPQDLARRLEVRSELGGHPSLENGAISDGSPEGAFQRNTTGRTSQSCLQTLWEGDWALGNHLS